MRSFSKYVSEILKPNNNNKMCVFNRPSSPILPKSGSNTPTHNVQTFPPVPYQHKIVWKKSTLSNKQRAHGAVVDLPLTGMQMNYLGLPWVTRFEAKVPLMRHVSIIWPDHWFTVDNEG